VITAVVLGCFAGVPATASASTSTDLGISVTDAYYSSWNSGTFTGLLQHMGTSKYLRFGFPWDVAGTWNGSGCVWPTTQGFTGGYQFNKLYDFLNAVRSTNYQQGTSYVPLIVLSAGAADNTWPGGLTDAANPEDNTYGDDQMVCAVYGLVSTLYSWGLSWPGMPIEAYNEPDYSPNPGHSDTTDVTADQAARLFADAWVGNANFGSGQYGHIIAGVFATAGAENINGIPGGCSGVGDPSSGGYGQQTYAAAYMCYLTGGSPDPNPIPPYGLPLSYFAAYANSWSFHDYDDITDSVRSGCEPSEIYNCGTNNAVNFKDWLQEWDGVDGLPHPQNDVWITESGNPAGWGVTGTAKKDASAAYGFRRLRLSGVAHLLWYQFTTPNIEPYCQQSNPPQSSGCDSPAGSGSGNYQACQSGNTQACASEPPSDPKASPDQFDSALIDSSPSDQSQDGYAPQDASYCILYNQVSTQTAFDNCVSKDQGS
jgi:hypothetical protein